MNAAGTVVVERFESQVLREVDSADVGGIIDLPDLNLMSPVVRVQVPHIRELVVNYLIEIEILSNYVFERVAIIDQR
jgi:hypothetical protein